MKQLLFVVTLFLFSCGQTEADKKAQEHMDKSLQQADKALEQYHEETEELIKQNDELEKLNDEIAARKKEVVDNLGSYFILKVVDKRPSVFGDNLSGVVITMENKSNYLIDDAVIRVRINNYMNEQTDEFNKHTNTILPHSKCRLELGDFKNAQDLNLKLMAITSKALGINDALQLQK